MGCGHFSKANEYLESKGKSRISVRFLAYPIVHLFSEKRRVWFLSLCIKDSCLVCTSIKLFTYGTLNICFLIVLER
jgi:hypothetical protein